MVLTVKSFSCLDGRDRPLSFTWGTQTKEPFQLSVHWRRDEPFCSSWPLVVIIFHLLFCGFGVITTFLLSYKNIKSLLLNDSQGIAPLSYWQLCLILFTWELHTQVYLMSHEADSLCHFYTHTVEHGDPLYLGPGLGARKLSCATGQARVPH